MMAFICIMMSEFVNCATDCRFEIFYDSSFRTCRVMLCKILFSIKLKNCKIIYSKTFASTKNTKYIVKLLWNTDK